jgi:hypothetical protein
MSDQRADLSGDSAKKTPYEPPKLMQHGKVAEVTQTSPPDALDSTMRPGERPRS